MGKRLDEMAMAREIHAGDMQRFEELYALYYPRVLGFAMKRVQSRSDAEDICQEVFLQVHRSIGSFQGRASLSTWIFGIAHNVTCRFFRKRGAAAVHFEPTESEAVLSFEPNAERSIDAARAVGKCTQTLAKARTPEHLEIFRLFYGQGRPLRSIARSTGRPTDSVKDSLRRSRNLLMRDVPDVRTALAACS